MKSAPAWGLLLLLLWACSPRPAQNYSRSPGVHASQEQPRLTAAQAAELVNQEAQKAAAQGTFGVASLLLGPEGRLLAVARNQVFQEGRIQDPTAHGERQIVDWYFEQLHSGAQLPAPNEVTLVTSLEPCLMCAGSILASELQVWVISRDPVGGLATRVDTMPPALRSQTEALICYAGVTGEREATGEGGGLYANQSVSPELAKSAYGALETSVDAIKGRSRRAPSAAQDPTLLNPEDNALKRLRKLYRQSLNLRLSEPDNPSKELTEILVALAKESRSGGHDFNAGALVDPFGNVLLAQGGREAVSPIQTPIFELARTYAQFRHSLSEQRRVYFPPFRQCRLVTLKGPAPDGQGLAELGAYSSSVRGPVPPASMRHWQYLLPAQKPEQLESLAKVLYPKRMPHTQQVRDQDAVQRAKVAEGDTQRLDSSKATTTLTAPNAPTQALRNTDSAPSP